MVSFTVIGGFCPYDTYCLVCVLVHMLKSLQSRSHRAFMYDLTFSSQGRSFKATRSLDAIAWLQRRIR